MHDVDYARAYWLFFLGAGLLFVLLNYLEFAATGRLTLTVGVGVLFGIATVAVSAYAARFTERAGGPTELNVRFAMAVGIFLLMAGLTVDRLLGA